MIIVSLLPWIWGSHLFAESADVNLGDCMDETALMRAATWPVKNWGCQVFLPPKSQPGRTTTVGQFYGSWMFMDGTLWLFNIAMENDPFIDGLPINSMVIFHGYVK